MARPTTLPSPWKELEESYGSVAKLAEACRTTPSTLWRWGRGEVVPPPLVREHVRRLAKRRGLAPPWSDE
jgi:hypothetical protein